MADRKAPHFAREADEESPLLPSPEEQTANRSESCDVKKSHGKSTQLLALISLMLGAGVAQLGVSLVLTMHPTIASEFNCLSESDWLITTYALAMAALQPLIGKLSDVFTRKSVLLCSYLFIALGCLQCATANTFSQVLIGRTISGMGGAGVSTLVAVITTDLVPIREVGPWRGYLNLVGTGSRSLGGPVGGYITDMVGWRWAFMAQVPILIFASGTAVLYLPTTSRKPNTDKCDEASELTLGQRLQSIDFLGASLIMLAVIGLMLPLAAGSKLPGGLWVSCGVPSVSIILLAVFVLVEHRYATDPIVHPTVMRNKDAMMSFGALAFQAAAHIGMMYSVPIHFQVTQGIVQLLQVCNSFQLL
ncbi:Vacuolar basic amino acid transporter 1 [Cyphellophora attinorum]|uniref:Vacuolar basic amino acid transporter 1 n=1 Tax=Cyphellophora attinorum TaxID=1664694 RepID=A0A0N0NKE9_9EURO|nr:Vacuolar basic amino acid transporter 1 [Phialophora attinorum]KPI37759.1 Vacuolar basic amino acid transporter 1 [Phialophora attinorum]